MVTVVKRFWSAQFAFSNLENSWAATPNASNRPQVKAYERPAVGARLLSATARSPAISGSEPESRTTGGQLGA